MRLPSSIEHGFAGWFRFVQGRPWTILCAVALLTLAAAGCYLLAGIKVVARLADRTRSVVLREYAIAQASIAVIFTLLLPPVIAVIDRLSANLALLLNSLLGIVCLTAGQNILASVRTLPAPARSSASRRAAVRLVTAIAAPRSSSAAARLTGRAPACSRSASTRRSARSA